MSVPLGIVFWLSPNTMNIQVLPFKLVLTLLPAFVRMDPAVTVPLLKPAGNVRLNWMPETELVFGLKVIGTLTEVPAIPEALPTVKVAGVAAEVIVRVRVSVAVPPELVALKVTFEVPVVV